MTAEAFAPAKINLTLAVTGRRADGYHLLRSLVVFADVGDRLRIEPAEGLSFDVRGAFTEGVPVDESNLVLRAAELLRSVRGVSAGASITLEKELPHGGGIGGGSADAAAALRALARLWGVVPLEPREVLALGADVPVCLGAPAPQWMSGIGEELEPAPALPRLPLVLVNPGVHLSTPAVFRAGAFSEPGKRTENRDRFPLVPNSEVVADWLAGQRNDLEAPATHLAPVIGQVLATLSGDPACVLARMSGSGSTVWGLFATEAEARAAARRISAQHPDWWVRPTLTASGT